MKAVIFDLDGTLINSVIPFEKMKQMMIAYLESVGVSPGLLNDCMLNFEITGKAEEDLRAKGFPEEQIRTILGRVSEIMNRVELESVDSAAATEGVREALRDLKANGLKLGVMTRGCREYAQKVLGRFGLREYFDAVVARDDVEKPKPNPEHAFHLLSLLGVSAAEALYVGDHWSDAECAKHAGLGFVLFRRPGQETRPPGESSFKAVDDIRDVVSLAISS